MRISPVCAVASTLVFTAVVFANVKPNQLFSDHAVLQNSMSVPMWGTADTGEKVVVSFAKQKKPLAGSKPLGGVGGEAIDLPRDRKMTFLKSGDAK